jgi:Holliday junction DNA helicase RuvA
MFAFLRGIVASKGVDQIALDVHGAGYLVYVPASTQRRLQQGQEAKLITYCYIREDAFQIFGFLHDEEKRLFITLLSITGIGPKVALSVLSVLTPAEVGKAVLEHDVTRFTKVPGVGKKMAQRIVLELKSKMGQDAELSAILGEPEALAAIEGDDVYEALISLGCSPQEARKATEGARKQLGEDAPAEELVRAALQSLARR